MDGVPDNGGEPVVIGGMVLDINAIPSIAANPRTTTPGKLADIFIKALGGQDISEFVKQVGHSKSSCTNLTGVAAECKTSIWFEPVSVAKSKRIASFVEYITYTSPNEDELVAMANALSSRNNFLPIQRDSNSFDSSIGSLFQVLKPPAWVLLEKGVKVVIVTLGPQGVFLCFETTSGLKKQDCKKNEPFSFSRKLYEAINLTCPANKILGTLESKGSHNIAVHFPALSATVVRLTGAGDCLAGGTLASLCSGLDIMQSVAVGIAAAKGAIENENNVIL
ncbi:carbohydrate kinase [Striga asiatica]|uniref:Carbohydrate kinase n=1 Tax=Striga asiatica TaxID=4170 RepID=A0A5A7QZI6_STRAF|nr:carbohydrate kinase [Striga asiatica]